jgi:ATP-dependent DNA helicase RecG
LLTPRHGYFSKTTVFVIHWFPRLFCFAPPKLRVCPTPTWPFHRHPTVSLSNSCAPYFRRHASIRLSVAKQRRPQQGSGPRKEIWEIPETVFREAIINSLSHRDYYDKGAVTQVEVFNNRVEISNPGGLVSAIPDAEFGKRSHSRNPLIFGLFARMHLVEQVGSGIGRMRDLMHTAGLPEPVFQKEGMFTVILLRSEKSSGESSPMGSQEGSQESSQEGSQESSQESSQRIIGLIAKNGSITTTEMAEIIGISRRAVAKQIAKLKKEGIIKRVGSTKSGIWEVSET